MGWTGKRDLAQHFQHLEMHVLFDYSLKQVLGYQLKKKEVMQEMERVAVNMQKKLSHLVRFVQNVLE
jgi:hypothetical protein